MNTFWSDQVQGVYTLYASRRLRFSDEYQAAYQKAFDIGSPQRILEIGCGPGALTQSLARWYPKAQATGVDLDAAFLRFAASQAPQLSFVEADATALPFAENSFDVTISNTVQEHLPPEPFFGQQRRVLRPGGVCLVLSARRGVKLAAPCVAQTSPFEAQIWERVEQFRRRQAQSRPVGQYWMNESQLPAAMERQGFRQVSTSYLAVNLTPDNPENPPERALAMIESHRQNDLEAVDAIPRVAPGLVSQAELARLRQLVEEKYDQRVLLYQKGEKQWDTEVSLTMIVRGVK